MKGIAVIGAGAFGTAIALTLARSGHTVTLWARDAEAAEHMQRERETGKRLPGHRLPPTLHVTSDLTSAALPVQVIAVPVQSLRAFAGQLPATDEETTLVSCAKGLELGTGARPTEILRQACPDARICVLTGPSFAADLARGLPTALTLAGQQDDLPALQTLLSTPALRLYRSRDIVGTEIGGALKNVVAIAAGMAMGAGLGESARAAVLTRGLSEMTRVAEALGGRAETLYGLSGLGDLVLTATSRTSRNYSAGLAFGAGKQPASVTTEGIATAAAMSDIARRRGLDAPIAVAVEAVTAGRSEVEDEISALLSRPLTEE